MPESPKHQMVFERDVWRSVTSSIATGRAPEDPIKFLVDCMLLEAASPKFEGDRGWANVPVMLEFTTAQLHMLDAAITAEIKLQAGYNVTDNRILYARGMAHLANVWVTTLELLRDIASNEDGDERE